MAENDDKRGLTKSRIFLLIFFGFAILVSITTILGTWHEERDDAGDSSTAVTAAPMPPAPGAPPRQ
ncbi:MAG TPA: hypothetical protein VL418_01805 [Devosiaceae bacterium]|nr:hypothetical protein [Devosiaceae bacterium]